MTSDAQRGVPPAVPRDGSVTVTSPSLARGLVWSDLVREMDEEWAQRRRRAEAGQTVIEVPRSATDDTAADHERGKAA